jgi:hypothetical protein
MRHEQHWPKPKPKQYRCQSQLNKMRMSKDTYKQIFDQMLSSELQFLASAASETNIKNAMKRVLGVNIKTGVIKSYSSLVLDESLNVHFTFKDPDGEDVDLILFYDGA